MIKALSNNILDITAVKNDRRNCKHYANCGLGELAVYLPSFYFDRFYYVPIQNIQRIYKVIAMSKGGFTGKGMFATLSYCIVEYDDGKKYKCIVKKEDELDLFLSDIKKLGVCTLSETAEQRLKDRLKELKAKKIKNLSPESKTQLVKLAKAEKYLLEKSFLTQRLTSSAKRLRSAKISKPVYKYVALFITLFGLTAFGYGIYSLLTHQGFSVYFLLFGFSCIFFFAGANVLPTGKNNLKAIQKQYDKAVSDINDYILEYDGTFPLPARYSHENALVMMESYIREGKAKDVESAFEFLKQDLKSKNSSVQLEQEEFDLVMSVKPLFLVTDYH